MAERGEADAGGDPSWGRLIEPGPANCPGCRGALAARLSWPGCSGSASEPYPESDHPHHRLGRAWPGHPRELTKSLPDLVDARPKATGVRLRFGGQGAWH